MNAIQFIKDHGVEKAREVVEGAPDGAWKYISGWHHRYGDEVKDWGEFIPKYEIYHSAASNSNAGRFDANKRQLECVDLSDLKRLVESVELIKCFDDLEQAKSWLTDLEDDVPYIFKGDTYDNKFYKHELKQAIADYELIYEVK